MFYNAKNASITIDHTTMDYLSFGMGSKVLIMIPGLGDALYDEAKDFNKRVRDFLQ